MFLDIRFSSASHAYVFMNILKSIPTIQGQREIFDPTRVPGKKRKARTSMLKGLVHPEPKLLIGALIYRENQVWRTEREKEKHT